MGGQAGYDQSGLDWFLASDPKNKIVNALSGTGVTSSQLLEEIILRGHASKKLDGSIDYRFPPIVIYDYEADNDSTIDFFPTYQPSDPLTRGSITTNSFQL